MRRLLCFVALGVGLSLSGCSPHPRSPSSCSTGNPFTIPDGCR